MKVCSLPFQFEEGCAIATLKKNRPIEINKHRMITFIVDGIDGLFMPLILFSDPVNSATDMFNHFGILKIQPDDVRKTV